MRQSMLTCVGGAYAVARIRFSPLAWPRIAASKAEAAVPLLT